MQALPGSYGDSSAELFDSAHGRTFAAAFDLIPSHGLLLWSGDVEAVLGVEGDPSLELLEDYLSLVRECDRPEVRGRMEEALGSAPAFETVCWIDPPAASPRRIRAVGVIQRSDTGEPTRVHCTIQDVTASQLASDPLSTRESVATLASEHRFRALAGTMREGFCSIGPDGAMTYANPRLSEMAGCADGELVGGRFVDLFEGTSGERLADLFSPDSPGNVSVEATLIRPGGEPLLATIWTAPVRDGGGVVIGHHAVISDITERRVAEAELRRVRKQLERLLESSPTVIYSCKRSHPFAFTFVGSNVIRLLGFHHTELVEEPSLFVRRIDPADREGMLASVLGWNGRSALSMIYRLRRADGTTCWIQDSRRTVREEGSGEDLIIGSLQDVTSLRVAQDSLKEQEALFRAVVEHTNDVVTLLQLDGTVLFKSPSFKSVLGWDPAAAVGKSAFDIVHPDDMDLVSSTIARLTANPEESATIEIRIAHADGSMRPFETILKILPERAGINAVLATCRDVTERKKAEERRGRLEAKLTHQAYHDSLTGLPNRKLFMERLSGALRRGREENIPFAALYLDIDRFKQINDTLGHVEADHVLQSFVARVLGALREGDMLARLGGDEFGIVLDGFKDRADVLALARRIEDKTRRPLNVPGGGEIICTASIGIVFGDDGIESIPEVIKRADTAMYYAKSNGRARFEVFAAEMLEERASVIELRNGLLGAIERGELFVEYQPCISLKSGEVTRCEALLRWRFGDAGLVPPDRFIRIAEEFGLIDRLGVWCLQTVCKQMRRWEVDGVPVPCVSINLSSQNVSSVRFLERIPEILAESGVGAHRIEVEISESALFSLGKDDPAKRLEGIRRTGVGIAVDDFGKGYSSLSHLRTLPAQAVKIDRSLVTDIVADSRSTAIVRAIVGLASAFGFRVVGEGVETDEQLEILRREGCDEAQGFLFSRPCSPEQFADFLSAWSAPWKPESAS